MANHRGEIIRPALPSSRARQGVGTAQAVAGLYIGCSDSDIVSFSSSTNVELLRARAAHATPQLDLLEAEASSSRRSHRSQSSKGSGTHVPTSAGPAAAPKGSLEAVPEASALRQDSVGRKPRLGQVEEQPGPSAAQAAAGSGVPAEERAPTDHPDGATYNTYVVNQNTPNLDASTNNELTRIHNEAQVYVDASRNDLRMEAAKYVGASVTHVQQQAQVEVVNLLNQQQDAHRDEAVNALNLQRLEHEAQTAQLLARVQAEAARLVADAERRADERMARADNEVA